MMANRPQKIKLSRDLAMYFAEKGKIMTQKEYVDQADKPIKVSSIRRVARSYSRALVMMQQAHPELMELIEKNQAEAAKPAPVIVPKPAVKAEVKPAVKPVVKKG